MPSIQRCIEACPALVSTQRMTVVVVDLYDFLMRVSRNLYTDLDTQVPKLYGWKQGNWRGYGPFSFSLGAAAMFVVLLGMVIGCDKLGVRK